MVSLRFPRGTQKPPPVARINLSHPFSEGLVISALMNEYGSYAQDSASGGGRLVSLNLAVGSGSTPRMGTTYPGSSRVLQWGSNREGPCLVFDSVFDVIDLGNGRTYPTNAVTVCVIRRKTDTTARNSALFALGTNGASVFPFTGNGSLIRAHVPWGDGHVYWDFGDTSVAGSRLDINGLSFTTREERWIFTAGPAGLAVWRNGVKVGSNSTAAVRALSPVSGSDGAMFLGTTSALTLADSQEINFFHSVGRQWPDDLCRWWSAEPYAHFYTPRLSARTFTGLFLPAPFLTIDGVEVTNVDKSGGVFEILKVSGRPARCNFRIPPHGPVSRPDVGSEVICTELGTDRLFAGLADQVEETGVGRRTRADFTSAGSYQNYLKQRTNVTEDFPEQSMYDRIEALRAAYLDVFGVTLDPSQVTGPTLPAQAYDGWVLQDVFNHITQQSGGYAGKINDYKVLSFALPTARPAPFNITDATGLAQRDVRVRRLNSVGSGNRVIVKFGAAGQDVTYRFTGDGVTDTFTIGSPISGPLAYTDDGAVGYGYLLVNAGSESIGGVSCLSTIWQYDPVNLTIFRTLGAPALNDEIVVTFITNRQPTAISENGSAATNPRELTVFRPKIADYVVALALSAELLAIAEIDGIEVEYETWERGIEPDMTQTIDLSLCGISASTFTITQVAIRFDQGRLKRFVRAAAGSVARPELLPQSDWDQWAGVGLAS